MDSIRVVLMKNDCRLWKRIYNIEKIEYYQENDAGQEL